MEPEPWEYTVMLNGQLTRRQGSPPRAVGAQLGNCAHVIAGKR